MALTKEQKSNILDDLTDKFSRAKTAILVDFNKLSVSKAMELRRALKAINAEYKVAKKTLINRVLRAGNFEDAKIDDFKTQVGVIFGYDDPVPVANSIWKFSKVNEALKILGGFMLARRSLGEGGGFGWYDKNKIIELAKLPSREILLGQVVRVIASPLSGLVTVLSGNMHNLVGVLNNIRSKK